MKPIFARTIVWFTIGVSSTCVTTNCLAAFTVSLGPSDLTVDRQILGIGEIFHSVDLFITHDGNGASSVSGFTFEFAAETPIMLLEDNSLDNPLGFGFPPSANSGRVALASLDDVDIGDGLTKRLTTLQLVIPDAAQFGDFELSLELTEAKRGFFPQFDILSEFSASAGTLRVSTATVPEPSSFALIGAIVCGVVRRRHRQN